MRSKIKLKYYAYSKDNYFRKIGKDGQRVISLSQLLKEADEVKYIGIVHDIIIDGDKLIITYYDKITNHIYSDMYKIIGRED